MQHINLLSTVAMRPPTALPYHSLRLSLTLSGIYSVWDSSRQETRPEEVEEALAASADLTVIDSVILEGYFWTSLYVCVRKRDQEEEKSVFACECSSQCCVF